MFQAVGNLNLAREDPPEIVPHSRFQPSPIRGSGTNSRKGKRASPAESNAASTGDDGGAKKKVLKLISPIWDHYVVELVNGVRVATCKYCNKTVCVE